MTSDRPSATPDYVLGTGDHELERLALQQRVWADQTEAWIDALGIEPGATVIDAGCGPGWVTRSLLERVGPTGRVIAIDESERWCEHVRSRAEREGWSNVDVREARLEELDLGPEADAVFVRWVLSFPPDPGAILTRLTRALRPGGRLIAIDYNHEGVSLFPPSAGFEAVIAATRSLYASAGGDAFVAGRFPALFRAAGLELESIAPQAIAGGPGTPAFEWADTFFTHHCHQMEERGHLSSEDKQRFLEEWGERRRDPEAIFFSPLVVAAIGALKDGETNL